MPCNLQKYCMSLSKHTGFVCIHSAIKNCLHSAFCFGTCIIIILISKCENHITRDKAQEFVPYLPQLTQERHWVNTPFHEPHSLGSHRELPFVLLKNKWLCSKVQKNVNSRRTMLGLILVKRPRSFDHG